jgi:hypothetical protein
MNTLPLNDNTTQEFTEVSVRPLILLLKKLKVFGLFEKHVEDARLRKGVFLAPSLMMAALEMQIFRTRSKNHFFDQLKRHVSSKNLSHLICAQSFPNVKTIDDFLMMLNPSRLEPILFEIFKKLQKIKLFTHHPSLKLGKEFLLAIDAFCHHSYKIGSQHKKCPFCLKRQRGDKIWYLHMNVVASLVFPNGFQLPLFIHRIQSTNKLKYLSEKGFKQECELSCLPLILRKIRSYLPKLKISILLDSLYATYPVLKLLQELHFGYAIVDKRQKNIREECVRLKKINSGFVKRQLKNSNQTIHYFNHIPYRKNLSLHVIDLDEEKKTGLAKKVHWQWIVHSPLNQENVSFIADRARCRWKEEDFFNTVKNRGFHIKHDWSRNHQAQSIWLYLTLIAFGLTSILSIMQTAQLARKGASLRAFMEGMLQDLLYLPFDLIFACLYPKNLRFSITPAAG